MRRALAELEVSGSPFGTNLFRIEGPEIGVLYPDFLCADASLAECCRRHRLRLFNCPRTGSSAAAAGWGTASHAPPGKAG